MRVYFTLDDIKDIGDEFRETELRKELAGKLNHHKLDFLQRIYRDEILKSMYKASLDYLKVIAPRFNGELPTQQDLQKTALELRNVPRKRSRHNLSLDDRAGYFLRNTAFKPKEVADFVAAKAEKHRAERTATLTAVNFKNYQELLKIENTVQEQYQDGINFFRALSNLTKRTPSFAHIANNVTYALYLLENSLQRAYGMKSALEEEMKRYISAPKSQQQPLKP
jgi:hypothetical protein